MFRKIVANLPFSPALVGQLGFYAKRLRREQVTRRLGLIFTILALLVQSFALIRPPEAANAASASNIIYGGVTSVQGLLSTYDNPNHDFKDLMNYIGITRAEVAKMSSKVVYVCSDDKSVISFGRQHHYSSAQGEIKHVVPRTNGGASTFYSVPLYRFDSVNGKQNCYESFVGQSAKVGWFSFMLKCGNLQVKKNVTPAPQASFISADCSAIQGWAYDARQPSLKVNVMLYAGGPPGKGKQIASVLANAASPQVPGVGAGHGFNVPVPDEYKKATTATSIYGIMVPLAGWTSSTVSFQNTVSIPGNCVKPIEKCDVPGKETLPKDSPDCVSPVATCDSLEIATITRTQYRLTAKATASGGAKVTGYIVTVTDSSGKKVYEKLYTSDQASLVSDAIDLQTVGNYKASVVVKTTQGDKTVDNCNRDITVAPVANCALKPDLPANSPDCKPCPTDKTIWYNDERCRAVVTESKEVKNMTRSEANANGQTAGPGDRIAYTIRTSNVGLVATTQNIEEDLTDVLEYAKLVDAAGGNLVDVSDVANTAPRKVLTWSNITLQPGQTDVRTFTVQINDTIAATPQAGGDPESYNCVITNTYGNTTSVNMECPPAKGVESVVKELPSTGPGENIIFGTALLMVVTFFYVRSRQMNKEVKLIRHDFNMGTL